MKKKILAIVLCIAMLAIAIVGGTMAYFTDSQAQTNTFTAGKVGIYLDEAVVKLDKDSTSKTFGDLVADGTNRTADNQKYHLFPGMNVTKDPTITVDADSENAYVAAKVTITGNLYTLMPVPGATNLEITQLASGGLMKQSGVIKYDWNNLPLVHENDTCVIYQDASQGKTDASGTWVMYIFIKEPMAAKSQVTLFDTLTISEKWDNDHMAKINGMEIKVEAYATQTNGFADCFTAMKSAFPTAFTF